MHCVGAGTIVSSVSGMDAVSKAAALVVADVCCVMLLGCSAAVVVVVVVVVAVAAKGGGGAKGGTVPPKVGVSGSAEVRGDAAVYTVVVCMGGTTGAPDICWCSQTGHSGTGGSMP